MKIILTSVLLLLTTLLCAQHKYVLKVKSGLDTALINSLNSKLNLQDITNTGNATTNKIKVANINLSAVPTFANQDSALKSGLISGDVYKLPADASKNSLLAIVNTAIDSNFNFIVDNSNNDTHLKFQIRGYSTYLLTVDWGDGTSSENFSGSASYTPDHTYTTSGVYHVSCSFNNYSLIQVVNIGIDFSLTCHVTAFHNADLFTNLEELDVEGTGMKLWTYSDGLAPTVNDLWFSSNYMNSVELNKLLVYLDGLTFNPGAKQLYIGYQQTAQGPTGEGLSAINSLQLKGWSINYQH
ncbi:MAG: hypothetical protein ACTHML_05845 [Ginsengibacter sp.]